VLRPLLIFGTRPEAIKMAPVVVECRSRPGQIAAIVCQTGQHRELADQVLAQFPLAPDEHLDLMTPDQALGPLAASALAKVDELLIRLRPDQVVVQGDTTSVLAASLAAFYRRIPVVHIEAGLRTGNLDAPWPEEFNRRVATLAATLHCAPTPRAAEALRREGVPAERIHVTGNTVIDALLATLARVRANARPWIERYAMLGDRPMVLVTAHRRESFGPGLERIAAAVLCLAQRFPAVAFVYPLHPNPNVERLMRRLLAGRDNILLAPPAGYAEFVWLMDRSRVILTDSGGVQEEAPTLRRPVLVLRETTERPEVVECGASQLVGTCTERIVDATSRLLTDPVAYRAAQVDVNPYGDGQAAQRIVDRMLALQG
jgi:UDP-N-acetylglucosamine 2-epimerase (non-hydrolysing)